MKKEIIISVLAVLLMSTVVVAARSIREYNKCVQKMDTLVETVANVNPDSLIMECEANIDSTAVKLNVYDTFDDTVGEGDEYQDYLDAKMAVDSATNEQSYAVAVRWYLTAYRGVLTAIRETAAIQQECSELFINTILYNE